MTPSIISRSEPDIDIIGGCGVGNGNVFDTISPTILLIISRCESESDIDIIGGGDDDDGDDDDGDDDGDSSFFLLSSIISYNTS